MQHSPRFHVGPRHSLPPELERLGRHIERLPPATRDDLMPLYERIVESFRLRAKILSVAKEALEQIRLDVAYLQFDLDVTRREKEELRRKLQES